MRFIVLSSNEEVEKEIATTSSHLPCLLNITDQGHGMFHCQPMDCNDLKNSTLLTIPEQVNFFRMEDSFEALSLSPVTNSVTKTELYCLKSILIQDRQIEALLMPLETIITLKYPLPLPTSFLIKKAISTSCWHSDSYPGPHK